MNISTCFPSVTHQTLQTLRRHITKQSQEVADTLEEHSSEQVERGDFSTEEAFILAMENVYKLGLKRRRFQVCLKLSAAYVRPFM